jgi:hypothetical protein
MTQITQKNAQITLSVLAVILAVVIGVRALAGSRQEIQRVRSEARGLEHQRDSLIALVQAREARQAILATQANAFELQANQLRDSVELLERRRGEAQLSVRQIRTVGALQTRLRKAFPQLGKTSWGLTTLPVFKGDTLGIEYLLVPAWFAETFVIDRANARSWREQKAKLLEVDSLRQRTLALEDSVVRLEAANTKAYQAGYESASEKYQGLSRKYVSELRKPRISVGSTLGFIAGAGAGLATCSVARE